VFDEPPDPRRARTVEELIAGLRLLKIWAGNPSYASIAKRVNDGWRAAGLPAGEWTTAKNTVADCFQVRPRPNDDLLIAIVEVLNPDPSYGARWRQALRIVRGEAEAATFVTAHDRLPEDLPAFVGRVAELDGLRRLVDEGGTVVISAIEGMPGVGKTAFAVHAGHLMLRRHPFDQVLFVDLRGFHPDRSQPPADPAAVLAEFLRLLGVPGDQVQPLGLEQRNVRYRELLRQRRALVVLDNAATTSQVRPLLPDGLGCLALVTSRRTLAGLSNVRHLPLDVFHPEEALELLRAAASDGRFDADLDAASLIAQLLGRLPLALGITAGRIRTDPWPLADHLERLLTHHDHDDAGRLLPADRVKRAIALRVEDRVRLALGLSYAALDAAARRLFRLLALHPGPDIDAHAAAALAGTDPDATQRQLDTLLAGNLLQQRSPGRYVLHDVTRAYAVDCAHDEDSGSDRRAALTRLLDHYRYTAAAAMDLLVPYERDRRPHPVPPATPAVCLDDAGAAAEWLATELPNLLACAAHAAEHGWPTHVSDLSTILGYHLDTHARYADALNLHTHALHATHRDLARHATALRLLGVINVQVGRFEQARGHLERAFAACRDIGDQSGQASALAGLAMADFWLGRFEQASEESLEGLALFRELGDRGGQGSALNNLGIIYSRLGRYDDAHDHLREALALSNEVGNRPAEASALANLGAIYLRWGRHDQAREHLQRAVRLNRDLGHGRHGFALTYLGAVYARMGRLEQARDHHEQALQLSRDAGDRICEGYALAFLGGAYGLWERYQPAVDYTLQALALSRDTGDRICEGYALAFLGTIYGRLGRFELAADHHQRALALARGTGDTDVETETRNGLGETALARGEPDQAAEHHRAALAIALGTGDRYGQARAHSGLARALNDAEHAQQAEVLHATLR
jgi:tetratricopeptide (TPR) repeat protein